MTQYERMRKGLIYDPGDPEIVARQAPYLDGLVKFNSLLHTQGEEKQAYMKRVFASCGENNYIEPPFHANWGGANLHFGSNIYANFNLTVVDDAAIYVGDRVKFGPNVTIATAGHPIDPELRSRGLQFNKEVRIGNNCWIGAGVVIMPGITIGDNVVVGAGSIVTRDLPDNVVAVGNPCKVLREIGQRDKEYFYKDEKIDWENLS
jgi:galactoside O-acetyltransferase